MQTWHRASNKWDRTGPLRPAPGGQLVAFSPGASREENAELGACGAAGRSQEGGWDALRVIGCESRAAVLTAAPREGCDSAAADSVALKIVPGQRSGSSCRVFRDGDRKGHVRASPCSLPSSTAGRRKGSGDGWGLQGRQDLAICRAVVAVVGFAGKAGKSWFLNYRAGGLWALDPLLVSCWCHRGISPTAARAGLGAAV